jgi:hypothetical protein
MRVEQERVFPEQIVELWNDGVVVGNGMASQLSQCLLELCGIKFHLGNPYVEEVPHPIPFVANDIRIKMFPLMTATHGYEATREAAMAAFAKSWRRECGARV